MANEAMQKMAQRFMQRKGRSFPGGGPKGPEGMSLPGGKPEKPEKPTGPRMGARGGGLPEGTEKPGNGFGRGLGEALAKLRGAGGSGPFGPAAQQFIQGARGAPPPGAPPPASTNAQPGNPAAPAARSFAPGVQPPGFGPGIPAQAMGSAMRQTMPGRMGQVMSPGTGTGRAPLPQGAMQADMIRQMLEKLKGGNGGSRY